jgi:hypothetical protein
MHAADACSACTARSRQPSGACASQRAAMHAVHAYIACAALHACLLPHAPRSMLCGLTMHAGQHALCVVRLALLRLLLHAPVATPPCAAHSAAQLLQPAAAWVGKLP